MTYGVSESDGWDVVTTVDTVLGRDAAEKHAVVSFSSVLPRQLHRNRAHLLVDIVLPPG